MTIHKLLSNTAEGCQFGQDREKKSKLNQSGNILQNLGYKTKHGKEKGAASVKQKRKSFIL